jgi:NAD(P)-dependent dehydrogenase (short-subunit alcohol dehydrogenase family)
VTAIDQSVSEPEVEIFDLPPTLRFDGRVAWITGASRGIGRSLAYALAGAGAEVMLSARSEEPLRQVAGSIEARGGRAEVVVGSITEQETLERTVELIESTWGRLDVLVNNAGIGSSFKRSEALEDAAVRELVDVNLLGPFACCRAALPLLDAAEGASVVNVSSIHGSRALERAVDYAMSKGGLEMLTRGLAVEWASRGVRVNSLAPGYLETEMTAGLRENPRLSEMILGHIPMARFGTVAEIVACAMFLASPISSYVTGATLRADGGWSAQ